MRRARRLAGQHQRLAAGRRQGARGEALGAVGALARQRGTEAPLAEAPQLRRRLPAPQEEQGPLATHVEGAFEGR